MANTSWFGFRGRISRKEYWLHYVLPLTAITFLVGFFDGLTHGSGLLSGVISLLLLVPSLAGYVKRAHDRDHSGWFLLLTFIPLIGWLWVIVELGFLRGTPGLNRFGRDPLQPALLAGGAGPAFR